MKKLTLVMTMIVCIFISCKNQDKKESNNKQVDKAVNQDNLSVEKFTLIFKGIITKQDNFQVFYTESEVDSYTEQKSVWVKVSPSDNKQEIKFELPKDVYPMNLRIDLGNNKEQEPIKIYEFVLKHKKYDYKIEGRDLYKYFKFNDEIKMLSDSLTFKLIPILYNGVEKHDPYMIGRKELENLLLEEL